MHDLAERRLLARVAVALRWRPEWPFTVVVVLAWVALLAGATAVQGQAPGVSHAHLHALGGGDGPGRLGGSGAVAASLPGWALMSVAMMVPLVLPATRHVGRNSLRRRRRRAMVLFVGVYVGVWVAFGVAALAVGRLARQALGIDGRVLLALALAVAAGWQLTRAKRRALLRCRRTVPLPPLGRRADAGCARFALEQGWRCVVSCWALMAVMAVVEHAALAWMAALTALVVTEELTPVGRRVLPLSSVALAMAAALVVLST